MFFILVFVALLYSLHIAGVLYPLIICIGVVAGLASVAMVSALCVFWVLDETDRLIDHTTEGKTMEAITAFFTGIKAKWDAISPTKKVTILLAVIAVAGATLLLS